MALGLRVLCVGLGGTGGSLCPVSPGKALPRGTRTGPGPSPLCDPGHQVRAQDWGASRVTVTSTGVAPTPPVLLGTDRGVSHCADRPGHRHRVPLARRVAVLALPRLGTPRWLLEDWAQGLRGTTGGSGCPCPGWTLGVGTPRCGTLTRAVPRDLGGQSRAGAVPRGAPFEGGWHCRGGEGAGPQHPPLQPQRQSPPGPGTPRSPPQPVPEPPPVPAPSPAPSAAAIGPRPAMQRVSPGGSG